MQEYLKRASKAYYDGYPIISDAEFDRLVDQFGFDEVGAKATGKTAKHVYRMYSLDKYYVGEGEEPLQSFEKIKTIKLDGAAIEILYIEGVLTRVCTRGDGIEGVDITSKFLDGRLVPLKINLVGVVQITGEIVAPKTIENSRNYAAGALNLKDIEEFSKRDITFIAYGLHPIQDSWYDDDMNVLEDEGFITVLTECPLLHSFPTDGFVMRIRENKTFEAQGYTSKFPKGAYAVKVRGEAVETTLLSVEWQVGKSGKVTPVANLEPVLVGDALVSRATLNNQAFIKELGLYVGCTVGIIRAGEIIPQIVYKGN
jgi:NAD-dependent DNA ligase